MKSALQAAINEGKSIDSSITRPLEHEYVASLARVDLTRCPADFREAFLWLRQAESDYYDLAAACDGIDGTLGGMAELLVTGKNPSDHFTAAMQRVDECNKLQLDLSALQHGVRVEPASR